MGIGDIASKALLRQSTLSRVIDKMEELKLVRRRLNPKNRRHVEVSLTPPGKKMFDKISRITLSMQNLLSSALTGKEQEDLNKLLGKLTNKLQEGRLRIV